MTKPHFTPAQIRKLRGKATQAEIAKKIGVTQAVWSAWELGTRTPSEAMMKLLRCLQQGNLD